MEVFSHRREAGEKLAQALRGYATEMPLVLALPRGGVPVAFEVARTLGAPLHVLVVRKLGAPGFPELGLGALSEGGEVYVDGDACERLGVTEHQLVRVAEREGAELQRRVQLYRGTRLRPEVAGRTVILVDDGVATGGSVRAALRSLHDWNVGRIVLATPVIAADTAEALRPEVDQLVCLQAPAELWSVGACYQSFPQVSDEEVVDLLAKARAGLEAAQPGVDPADDPEPVQVPCHAAGALEGMLGLPERVRGLVLFVRGGGGSYKSGREQQLAYLLREAGLGTLLIDLLTPHEQTLDQGTGHLRHDAELLGERLVTALAWLARDPRTRELPLCLFGTGLGGAAALAQAAREPGRVRALVVRAGRTDLVAPELLARVTTPVLLLVGSEDPQVLRINEGALHQLQGPRELVVVPGAGPAFEERGAVEAVGRLAGDWFLGHQDGAREPLPQARPEVRPHA